MNQDTRCPWRGTDPRCVACLDQAWGTPSLDDRRHAEAEALPP